MTRGWATSEDSHVSCKAQPPRCSHRHTRAETEIRGGEGLHRLGLALKDLKAPIVIGDAQVDLSVKAAEAAEGCVQHGGAVGRGHDDDV